MPGTEAPPRRSRRGSSILVSAPVPFPVPADPSGTPPAEHAAVYERLTGAGIRRVTVLAWRDIGHPDSGGSEIYVDRVTREWVRGGLHVTLLTGRAVTQEPRELRHGVSVERRGGKLTAVPRLTLRGLLRRLPPGDATVEIWNGLPFLTPMWAQPPRLAVLHHLHDRLWHDFLPPGAAHAGRWAERSLFPRLYRTTPVATLARSSRDELVRRTPLPAGQVRVVQPGVDERFTPGGTRSANPKVLIVARLVPSKRVDRAISAALEAARALPGGAGTLDIEVIGTGPESGALASTYGRRVRFRGQVDDSELLDAYRSAWLIVSASDSEGWGMTLTEAAACGTPAVARRTPGHRDAVQHGISGLLADERDMADAIAEVLTRPELRQELARGAVRRASELTWSRTAAQLAALLTPQVNPT